MYHIMIFIHAQRKLSRNIISRVETNACFLFECSDIVVIFFMNLDTIDRYFMLGLL